RPSSRSRPLVPGTRRATANPLVGRHAPRRQAGYHLRPLDQPGTRYRDRSHRTVGESGGRSAARRPGPARLMSTLLRIENLRVSFSTAGGHSQPVDGVNLTVARGATL